LASQYGEAVIVFLIFLFETTLGYFALKDLSLFRKRGRILLNIYGLIGFFIFGPFCAILTERILWDAGYLYWNFTFLQIIILLIITTIPIVILITINIKSFRALFNIYGSETSTYGPTNRFYQINNKSVSNPNQVTSLPHGDDLSIKSNVPEQTENENKIIIKSSINYEHAKIIYKVKIENNKNSAMGDVRFRPFVSKTIFLIDNPEKTISLIKPNESSTVTFKLNPKGECGNVKIHANISYYDNSIGEYKEINAEPKTTEIICPVLKVKTLTEQEWRENTYNLLKAQDTTEQIPIGAETLFEIISDILKDMNLFMLPECEQKSPQIFRCVGRFSAAGKVHNLQYAVQIEVVGGPSNSKLILKTFAPNEASLIGFHHKILDEIEERVKIKEYIPMNFTNITIKDSVIHRSDIG
jgi:hypothetical protein